MNLRSNFSIISVLFLILCGFVIPKHSYALDANTRDQVYDQLNRGAGYEKGEANVESQDPRRLIFSIIQIALGLIGSIFLVLLIMAGYWLAIARGREDYIEKAQKTAWRAIVGIVIVLMSYSFTVFISGALTESTSLGEDKKDKGVEDKMLHQQGY